MVTITHLSGLPLVLKSLSQHLKIHRPHIKLRFPVFLEKSEHLPTWDIPAWPQVREQSHGYPFCWQGSCSQLGICLEEAHK